MPMYEYKCPKGHMTEKLIPLVNREGAQFCSHPGCGELAKFVVSAANLDWQSMGKDDAFPTMSDKWAKIHTNGAKE